MRLYDVADLSGSVVLVGCPGADPHDTWTRDPLSRSFFKKLSNLRLNQTGKNDEPLALKELVEATPVPLNVDRESKSTLAWPRSGIRLEANTARVLTYDHGYIEKDKGLENMAAGLLSCIYAERTGESERRPLFFICHSIGGLVVKMALQQAGDRNSEYRHILENCYGVTFFATPHRGSSYLSIGEFDRSIQQLLHLSVPLEDTLKAELKPDDTMLLKLDDRFKELASEFQVWSFHETEDSILSTDGITGLTDIPFKAPIVSLRSAILGVRHEKVYALQSSHANCASFGTKNAQTLRLYLFDLGTAIQKAEQLNKNAAYMIPLNLEQRVMIEVHGFYESGVQDSPSDTILRLFSAKNHSLEAFWDDGPDGLLEKRLSGTRSEFQDPADGQFLAQKRRGQSLRPPAGKPKNTDEQRKKTRRPSLAKILPTSSEKSADAKIKESPKRSSNTQDLPEPAAAKDGNKSSVTQSVSSKGAIHNISSPNGDQEGTGPRISTPETLVSQMSNGTGAVRPLPVHRNSSGRILRQHLEPIGPAGREVKGSETTLEEEFKIGPAVLKPNIRTRKFVWIHTPFNNPIWVRKVFETLKYKEAHDYPELFSAEHWTSRHESGRHSQHHACFLKPSCGFVSVKSKQHLIQGHSTLLSRGLQRADSLLPRQGCLYLYFPFLHFDSYKRLVKRRDIIKWRAAQGRARPVPPDVAKDTSLESRVIWEYLGHDPPLNCRRTLDQYRYPSLHDTRARDDDQMLYKMTKERVYLNDKATVAWRGPVLRGEERIPTYYDRGDAPGLEDDEEQEHSDSESETNDDDRNATVEDDVLDGNVLMVDQLWLWAVDSSTSHSWQTLHQAFNTSTRLIQT